MSESKSETAMFDEFEEKEAELQKALLKAYAAGYGAALDDFEVETPFDAHRAEVLMKNGHIRESHYYFWDGRTVPLVEWIGEQFGVAPEDADAW